MRIRINFFLRDQSGAALVIALIMIIVLTVIAVAASFTSIFEIMLSGNKRATTDAFYTADGGVQAVLPAIANFYTSNYILIPDSGSLPQAIRNESIDSKLSSPPILTLPAGVSFADPPDVTIYHTTKTGCPPGLGLSAYSYDCVYFVIDSVGRDQLDVSFLKSKSEVIEKVFMVVPLPQEGS